MCSSPAGNRPLLRNNQTRSTPRVCAHCDSQSMPFPRDTPAPSSVPGQTQFTNKSVWGYRGKERLWVPGHNHITGRQQSGTPARPRPRAGRWAPELRPLQRPPPPPPPRQGPPLRSGHAFVPKEGSCRLRSISPFNSMRHYFPGFYIYPKIINC